MSTVHYEQENISDPAYPHIRTAMRRSLGISVLMLVGKVGAFLLTDSTAILSDAMESVIHIVATGLAAWSAWFATLPASREFPYGHGKISYFSAGFEGALILIASFSIMYKAIEALIIGPQLHRLSTGLLIIFGLGLTNLFLGLYLIRTGKKHKSLILEANGKHVFTDMWTSAAVVVGVLLVWVTGIVWFDPVIAILAALQIMLSAFSLLKQSFAGLMERTDSEMRTHILSILESAIKEEIISDYHQLRFRAIQNSIWLEVHLLMPANEILSDAHQAASKVEKMITEQFPEYEIVITSHLEPDAHEHAHPKGHEGLTDPLKEEAPETEALQK